jgi:hypothetical protein
MLFIAITALTLGFSQTAYACGDSGWAFYESPDCPGGDLPSSSNLYITCSSTQVFVGGWHSISCSSTGGTDWWYSGYCQESAACSTPACVSNQGQSCNINACGTAGGTYNCDGTCSGSTPATPYTVGAACNRNVCGGTGTITDACTGACSAQAPSCDTTAPSGSINASPSSAAIGATITIAMSGSDSGSGVAWLLWNDAYSGGAQWYDCRGAASCNTSWAFTPSVSGSYTFTGTIYDKAGNTLGVTSNTVTVALVVPSLSYPSGYWQRLWYGISGTTPNVSLVNFKGEDLTQTAVTFSKDYTSGVLPDGGQSYAQANSIGFKSSRTINFPVKGTGVFHVCSDDGMRIWIGGPQPSVLEEVNLNLWSNHSCGSGISFGRWMDKGNYRFQIDYYENTENAKVEFTYWVQHGLGLTLNKTQYNFGEDIALTAKYSGLDQRYAYKVELTLGGLYAVPGGTTSCDISAGALGDPRENTIGTCTRTFTTDIPVGNYSFCAYLRSGGTDYNTDCVDFAVVGVENIPPTVTINTASGQWKNANPILDIDFSDNVALSSVGYKVGSGGTWRTPTTNGTTPISVSGASYTTNWKILDSDWTAMPEGDNIIYVRAQDTSGNCKGCDESKSLVIKKDTGLPVSIIESERDFSPAPGWRISDNTRWLRQDTVIQIGESDATSGLAVCEYTINDLGRPGIERSETRTCGTLSTPSSITITVGPTGDCQTQGDGRCQLVVISKDRANNANDTSLLSSFKYLNIDYTAPTAQ